MATAVAVATMKVAQVVKPDAGLQVVEREIPEPGAGEVRIKVQACGVCHSDALVVEGLWPGLPYPRIPGHEVVGVIEKTGSGVTAWRNGQRVGVGWHGGASGAPMATRCSRPLKATLPMPNVSVSLSALLMIAIPFA